MKITIDGKETDKAKSLEIEIDGKTFRLTEELGELRILSKADILYVKPYSSNIILVVSDYL